MLLSADATADAGITLDPGAIIEFVVPDGSPIVNALASTFTLELILIGGSSDTLRGSNCDYPFRDLPGQEVAMLDPDPERGQHITNLTSPQPIIPVAAISHGQRVPLTDPLRAGTRLRHISSSRAPCTDGITIYDEFQAEVQ